MRVSKLIELLKQLSQDYEVIMSSDDIGSTFNNIYEVGTVSSKAKQIILWADDSNIQVELEDSITI